MQKFFEAIGGRKFILMLVLLAVGIVVDLFTTRGLSTSFRELMVYLAAIYTTGNSVSSVAGALKDGAKAKAKAVAKAAQPVTNTDLEEVSKQILGSQEAVFNSIQLNSQALGEILKKMSGN